MNNSYIYNYVSKDICKNNNCFCKEQKYTDFFENLKHENKILENNLCKEILQKYNEFTLLDTCEYVSVMIRSSNFIKNLDIHIEDLSFYVNIYLGHDIKNIFNNNELVKNGILEHKLISNYIFRKTLLHINEVSKYINLECDVFYKSLFNVFYYYNYSYIYDSIIKINWRNNYQNACIRKINNRIISAIKKGYWISFSDIFKNISEKEKIFMYDNIKSFFEISKWLDGLNQIKYVLYAINNCFNVYGNAYTYLTNYIKNNRIIVRQKNIINFIKNNLYQFFEKDKIFLENYNQQKILISLMDMFFGKNYKENMRKWILSGYCYYIEKNNEIYHLLGCIIKTINTCSYKKNKFNNKNKLYISNKFTELSNYLKSLNAYDKEKFEMYETNLNNLINYLESKN